MFDRALPAGASQRSWEAGAVWIRGGCIVLTFDDKGAAPHWLDIFPTMNFDVGYVPCWVGDSAGDLQKNLWTEALAPVARLAMMNS
jgi:hypothetical protein